MLLATPVPMAGVSGWLTPAAREQFDGLVAGLPWQRLSAPRAHAITVV